VVSAIELDRMCFFIFPGLEVRSCWRSEPSSGKIKKQDIVQAKEEGRGQYIHRHPLWVTNEKQGGREGGK
jgi:hypothetical protein